MKKILIIIGSIIIAFILIIIILNIEDTHLDPATIVKAQSIKPNNSGFEFPVGFHKLHSDPSINFFLNRLHSMGYAPYDDMVYAGEKIKSLSNWKAVMKELASKAEQKKRLLNAAFYYRAAEFYTPWNGTDKFELYEKFIRLLYKLMDKSEYTLSEIPYNKTSLSVLSTPHSSNSFKGTIILHAGYDGFKEELLSTISYLTAYGYDVITFDVPWMSKKGFSEKLEFDYRWEKIISAIIDYYELEEVTLFGLSFGGWLALRAAAFEPRIKRVIASSVSYDVNQYTSKLGQIISQFAIKNMKDYSNEQIQKQMNENIQSQWFFDHLMHITNTQKPIDAAIALSQINEENLHSEKVTQDVLILTGHEDHLIPFKMHNMQVKALKNAASLTPKVFTRETHGQNHCQVGNLGLALSVVIEWLDTTAE